MTLLSHVSNGKDGNMIDVNGDIQVLTTSIENINLGKTYDDIHKFIMDTSKTFTAGVVFEELYVNIYNYAYTSRAKTPSKEKKDTQSNPRKEGDNPSQIFSYKGQEYSIKEKECDTTQSGLCKKKPLPENGPVSIRIVSTPDYIKMTLSDFGIPFDPVQRGNWTAKSSQIGGRGIDIIKSYTSSFRYERVFDMNVVEVVILQR